MLSGGISTVQGEDAFDEEICMLGNRVLWSAAGIVRRRFTLECPATKVLQVGITRLSKLHMSCPMQALG